MGTHLSLFFFQHLLVALLVSVASSNVLRIILPGGTSSVSCECAQFSTICRFFRIFSDCTVNLVKDYLSYIRSPEVDLLSEGCAR